MDIVEEIKKCKTDEELKALADEAIDVFTDLTKKENLSTDFLGDRIGYNPRLIVGEDVYESNNVWYGYIPKGTKVVYARFKDDLVNQFTNNGYYYYLDDDSYVYDFFKYIKDEEDIEDEFDLIVLVHKFIEGRFGNIIEPKSREVMHQLIYKDETTFYPPVHEHSIKDFYHNGSAKCTEMALMAQNLLSLLNLEVIYINDFNHAYNIYVPRNQAEDTEEAYIVDFGNWVLCVDGEMNPIGKLPYIGKIKNANENLFEDFFDGKKRMKFPNYVLVRLHEKTMYWFCGEDRDYGVDYLPLNSKDNFKPEIVDFKEKNKLLIKERINGKHANMDF